jgi:beta-lactamase class A
MGANDIQVLRGVEDNKAYDLGLNNTVTAFDLALIFEKIARKEPAGKKASKQMLQILFDQKFKEIIPAKLPKEAKVAHKTGSITGVQHDSGIVFLNKGKKYVLVLLSRKLKDTQAGVAALAEVSGMVYDFVR